MSQTANRIVKNTGFLYARMGITMFISLWTTRLVLNALGAIDYGIFNVVGGAIGMLAFLNSSMAAATQRYMSFYQGAGEEEKCKEIFNASIVLHFFISFILVICLLLMGYFFFAYILNIPDERTKAAYVVYGTLIVSTTFAILMVPYDATINAHENMRYFAIVGVIESLLKLIVALVVVHVIADKLIVYGILMSCVPLVVFLVIMVYCHKRYAECKISFSKYLRSDVLRDMTGFAGWNLLTSISSVFTQHGLGIILNHFYGSLLNAAQGVANQLSGMLMAFCNGMLKALSPVITKNTGAGQQEKVAYATLFGCKYSFVLLAIFAIPCILEMPLVLRLWIKNIPEWCILFCQLQLLRSVVEQLFVTLRTAIAAQGIIRQASVVNSFLNILPFVLTYLMFSKGYPPYMMYVTWILCYSVGCGISMVYYSSRLCNIKIGFYLRIVLYPCIVISLSMVLLGLASVTYIEPSYGRIALTFLFSTIGLLVAVLLVMTRYERELFLQIPYLRLLFYGKINQGKY